MKTTRAREPGESVFGAIILVGSVFILYKAYAISGFSSVSSPGVFPMFAAAAMVISAIVIVFDTRKLAPRRQVPDQWPLQRFGERVTPAPLVVVTALIVAYLVALEPLGFLASSLAFLVVSMLYLHRGNALATALVAAASLAAIYLVFKTVFSVVLPQGWLFR